MTEIAEGQSFEEDEEEGYSEVVIGGDWRFVAVVSHDCEFNEGKRNKFLVARIERVPGNLTDEQRIDLRESNDVEARADAEKTVAGVDSFVYDPLPGALEDESVASFKTITPLPTSLIDYYVSTKKAELEHEQRLLFRKKLAWFFGRFAEDVPDEEKFPRPVES